MTIELGLVLQGVSQKVDKLAEFLGSDDVTFLYDEVDIIESLLHRIWDMKENTIDFDSYLDEVLYHVRQGNVDPNELPDVIRNLKKNLDTLPNQACTFKIDGKTGNIIDVELVQQGQGK